MIQIYSIPVPKDKLRSMPKDERALLLLLGYAANQLAMLQKLLMFCTNATPPDALEETLAAVQTQMMLRLAIGVLNEAWLLISLRFIGSPVGKAHESSLDAGGRQALANLRRQFGGSNLLNKIRNNFAFHYPHNDDVEKIFQLACSGPDMDEHLSLHFSHHGFNSMFLLSDLIFVAGIHDQVRDTAHLHPQETIMKETMSATGDIIEFSKAYTAMIWKKYFGAEMLASGIHTIVTAPHVDDVSIPFFVEVMRSPTPSLALS